MERYHRWRGRVVALVRQGRKRTRAVIRDDRLAYAIIWDIMARIHGGGGGNTYTGLAGSAGTMNCVARPPPIFPSPSVLPRRCSRCRCRRFCCSCCGRYTSTKKRSLTSPRVPSLGDLYPRSEQYLDRNSQIADVHPCVRAGQRERQTGTATNYARTPSPPRLFPREERETIANDN